MAGRVLRVGELVRYRLSRQFAWNAAVVETILLRDRACTLPLQQPDEVDLDEVPGGLLVWFTYRDRMGRLTVHVRTEAAQGSVAAHEVRVPGEGMVETDVWSGDRLWTIRLWEGGKVRIDPAIPDSAGKAQILNAHLQPDGTLKLDAAIENLPADLLEDAAWAMDLKMGGPRLRRELHAGARASISSPTARGPEPGDVARDTLRDLLGRLGMHARAAKLKDATVDELRAELLAVLKGEALARLAEERAALVALMHGDEVGGLDDEEDDPLLGARRLAVMRQEARTERDECREGMLENAQQLAAVLGVTLQEGQLYMPPLLAAIEALKARPAPAVAGGDFELAQPAKGRGKGKAAPPATVDVQVAVRDRLMQLAHRCGADTEALGMNGASAEEIEAAIEAQAAALLPEVEIACPHCEGGMLITPELLKPPADEVQA